VLYTLTDVSLNAGRLIASQVASTTLQERQRRFDWPAQPYLNPAEEYFSRIFSIVLRLGPVDARSGQQMPCLPSDQLPWMVLEAALRQITSPSNHRRRSRRNEWRANAVKWKDDTCPPSNIAPAIIFLVYVGREIALQDHRAEIVAEESARRELALLLIAKNGRVQIGGIVTDPSHLHLPKLWPTVRSTLMKFGLHPLTGNVSETGTGHGDNWGLSVTDSRWMPQMTFAVAAQSFAV
jgi:hypothetical protein